MTRTIGVFGLQSHLHMWSSWLLWKQSSVGQWKVRKTGGSMCNIRKVCFFLLFICPEIWPVSPVKLLKPDYRLNVVLNSVPCFRLYKTFPAQIRSSREAGVGVGVGVGGGSDMGEMSEHRLLVSFRDLCPTSQVWRAHLWRQPWWVCLYIKNICYAILSVEVC